MLNLPFRYVKPIFGPGSVSASASQQGLHYSYYHFLTPFNSNLGNKIMFFSYCTHCSRFFFQVARKPALQCCKEAMGGGGKGKHNRDNDH